VDPLPIKILNQQYQFTMDDIKDENGIPASVSNTEQAMSGLPLF
jgi:hypothetical protein